MATPLSMNMMSSTSISSLVSMTTMTKYLRTPRVLRSGSVIMRNMCTTNTDDVEKGVATAAAGDVTNTSNDDDDVDDTSSKGNKKKKKKKKNTTYASVDESKVRPDQVELLAQVRKAIAANYDVDIASPPIEFPDDMFTEHEFFDHEFLPKNKPTKPRNLLNDKAWYHYDRRIIKYERGWDAEKAARTLTECVPTPHSYDVDPDDWLSWKRGYTTKKMMEYYKIAPHLVPHSFVPSMRLTLEFDPTLSIVHSDGNPLKSVERKTAAGNIISTSTCIKAPTVNFDTSLAGSMQYVNLLMQGEKVDTNWNRVVSFEKNRTHFLDNRPKEWINRLAWQNDENAPLDYSDPLPDRSEYYNSRVELENTLKSQRQFYAVKDDDLFTLFLTTPDGSLPESEMVHWCVTNIPASAAKGPVDIDAVGDTIVPYLQPLPLGGTGYHRYVAFVAWQTKGHIDASSLRDQVVVPSNEGPGVLLNRHFDTESFLRENRLRLEGATFWQSTWDQSVTRLFHSFKIAEPVFELVGIPTKEERAPRKPDFYSQRRTEKYDEFNADSRLP